MADSPIIELQLDTLYRNTNDWKKPEDVFNRFFRFQDGKGINNTAGFRPKSKIGKDRSITDSAFCLLVTNFNETEWPDNLDRETGTFVYYGDNRAAGNKLEETAVGGNRLLRHVFEKLHMQHRNAVQPFLCFEKVATDNGTFMRFLGLACPGGPNVSSLEDLVAVWRVKEDRRFQNYRAIFTILKEERVTKAWLEDMVSRISPADSVHCPAMWKQWVQSGIYAPLKCIRQREPRSKIHQLPAATREVEVLQTLYEQLSDREFEFAAAEFIQLMDERFTDISVTQFVRDGGRDVLCHYKVGHDLHQIHLSVSVEAKKWNPQTAVGVKPMMRLLSRLKHRDIGVFITTSFFDKQVQEELIEDGHPVLLVSGGDIARLLIEKELTSGDGLSNWIKRIKLEAAGGVKG